MKKSKLQSILVIVLLFCIQNSKAQTSALVAIGSNGKLVYTPDNKGNIIPDYSGVGYRNSEYPIPTVGVVKTVSPVAGDNLANIQNAINEVSAYPIDSNGFRGTILFTAGTYNISDSVTISASGIVLRGEGFNGAGTNFVATKTSQFNLINFSGASGTAYNSASSTRKAITDSYVPIGTKQITVASGHTFVVGDAVFVHRIPNDAWISLLGMNLLTSIIPQDPTTTDWVASAYDMDSERKIMAINGNVITLDAPIMDVIDPVYATGELVKFTDSRIQKCGIENMRISSTYTSSTDENHGWEAVSFENIINGWARNLEVYYFGYSAVHINSHASYITVDTCKMLDAKSIIDGGRRYSFDIDGQRSLVQNCTTRNGRHDYVNGSRTCGPNVFYNSTSTLQKSDIGPHHRWSTGILFDNLTGDGRMDVQNRLDMGSGHGWSGAQIMFWNCVAARMAIQDPEGDACNWAIGCISPDITGVGDATTEPIGIIESQGTKIVAIPSLFQAQLSERLLISVDTQPTSVSVCSGSSTSFTTALTEVSSTPTIQWQRSTNGSSWTDITANLDSGTVYSGFTTSTLVFTGTTSALNAYQYKAVFTNINGSVDSNVAILTVTTTPSAPTAATQTVCSPATIASLVATGTDLKWYSSNISTFVRASTYSISTGTYYVSQTLNSCESTRTAVAVTVASATAAPSGSSSLTVCNISTVANLTATGTALKWYVATSGGSALATDTALSSGTYYATQTLTTNGVGCESSSRKSVAVTLAAAIALPTASPQTFCSATVASLVATGTALKWYDSSSGGSALASTTALTSGTYFVTQTLTSCESARTSVAVTLNSIAPTAESQVFCGSSHTINDLIAQGTNLKWYDASTGGSALASTDPLSTRTYYVTQTIDGCESTRTSVGVTVITTQSPTATSTQAFCGLATVGNLAGNGTDLKWYNDVGTLLTLSSGLSSGTYFVSQTLNSCESLKSSVTVTINSITAPTPESTQNFCISTNPTVANLSPSGAGIKWYLASGGALATSTALISGTNYYVSQNATGTCESDRSSAVTVSIISAPTAPTTSLKTYCSSSSVASLTSATGTDLKWYIASTGGSALLSTDLLTSRTYYVSQTLNGCESSRSSINVTVNGNLAPSAIAQNFCGSATVASLVATGTALKWYNEASGGTPLVSTTTLVSGIYYVSQTTDTCESTRTSVTVTVVSECDNTTTPAAPIVENSTINLCFGALPIQLSATSIQGYTLKWYTVATSGTASTTAPTIVTSPAGSKTYYVSQKLGSTGLESSRTPITVNIIALPATAGTIVSSDAILCKYVGQSTEFTLTTPAVTTAGTSYVWTVPTALINKVNTNGSTTNVLTVNLSGVTQTSGGDIGNIGVRVKNTTGCVSATEKTITLKTKIPTAPSKLVLTSTEPSLSGLTAITKVGPYMGTDMEFTLTATDISNTAHHYKWVLPYGVNITKNSATITQTASPSASGIATSTSNVITVDFLDVDPGIGVLPISVYSVGGCQESIARTLNLARVVPTAPKALALTTLASNAITLPVATADKITKVSPYAGKSTALTLVATPITVQGATATSYEWVFPAGVNSYGTTSETVNGVTTISSASNIITVDFEGVDSGVLELPISVYAVNGAGRSLARTFKFTSAAPATPVITYSSATTTFDVCHTTTYTATSILGATYNWIIPPGATGTSTTNSIVVDFSNVTSASAYAVTCSATNGTGTSAVKSLTIKKAATCATPRIAPEASTAEAFKVVAYPNPSREEGFRIKSGNGKSFGVQVYDLLGRSIEQRQMNSDSKIGSNYAKGVYNVIVTQDANVKTLRVIKR